MSKRGIAVTSGQTKNAKVMYDSWELFVKSHKIGDVQSTLVGNLCFSKDRVEWWFETCWRARASRDLKCAIIVYAYLIIVNLLIASSFIAISIELSKQNWSSLEVLLPIWGISFIIYTVPNWFFFETGALMMIKGKLELYYVLFNMIQNPVWFGILIQDHVSQFAVVCQYFGFISFMFWTVLSDAWPHFVLRSSVRRRGMRTMVYIYQVTLFATFYAVILFASPFEDKKISFFLSKNFLVSDLLASSLFTSMVFVCKYMYTSFMHPQTYVLCYEKISIAPRP